MKRRATRQIQMGLVPIGEDAPIAVQSMATTYTRGVQATVAQIHRLEEVGCGLIRAARPGEVDVQASMSTKRRIYLPLIIDPLERGPQMRKVSMKMRDDGTLVQTDPAEERRHEREQLVERMVERTLEDCGWAEDLGFSTYKVSLKSSNVLTAVAAYRQFAAACDVPLHLGITEAGTLVSGSVKSAVGFSQLLGGGVPLPLFGKGEVP